MQDRLVHAVREALERGYQSSHPRARIDVKRYNPACIWARVIDPDFTGLDSVDRMDRVWEALESTAPEEALVQISMLFLFTPRETKKSQMNAEFENPHFDPP